MSVLPALCQNCVRGTPLSRVSPSYIKEWLPVIPQLSLSGSFKLGVFPAFASLVPAGHRVWMQFGAVLEYACSPAPCLEPSNQLALTYNVLGAIRTPSELLDTPLDPCGFTWGDWMQTHHSPLLLLSLSPCHLVPHGTNKLSASLLDVLRLAEMRRFWPCDVSTDSRKQPPQLGHVACLCVCVTEFWLLDCNAIPLWEKKINIKKNK